MVKATIFHDLEKDVTDTPRSVTHSTLDEQNTMWETIPINSALPEHKRPRRISYFCGNVMPQYSAGALE